MSGPIRDFTPTMSSMQIVDFINEERKAKEAAGGKRFIKLQHESMMTKTPKVLGKEGAQKFLGTYIHEQNGRTYDCYYFPEREACLIAMSYSYELQAKVWDYMKALENEFNGSRLTTARDRITIHKTVPFIYEKTGASFPKIYDAISAAAGAENFPGMTHDHMARVVPRLKRIEAGADTQDDWRLLHDNGLKLSGQQAQLALPLYEPPAKD